MTVVRLIMSADNNDMGLNHASHRCVPAPNLLQSDLNADWRTNVYAVDQKSLSFRPHSKHRITHSPYYTSHETERPLNCY
jgi:hypothetical protein